MASGVTQGDIAVLTVARLARNRVRGGTAWSVCSPLKRLPKIAASRGLSGLSGAIRGWPARLNYRGASVDAGGIDKGGKSCGR